MPVTIRKNIIRIIWLCVIAMSIIVYMIYRQQFTKENIAAFLSHYRSQALIIYFVICVLRGITLIPATPFLFAGILLFGSTPLLLFAIFMCSILVVSTFLYYAAAYVELETVFERMSNEKMQKIRRKLEGPKVFWFILLWAFAPFTPTDLICYSASVLRIKFSRFITPLLIGEGIICAFYIFNSYWLL